MNKYLLLFSSIFLGVVGQLFLKSGLAQREISLSFNSLISTILSPKVFAGFFSYGLSSIVWLFVLKKFPLSVAFPSLSMSYVVIMVLSWKLFNEQLTINKIGGCLLITLGVCLLFK